MEENLRKMRLDGRQMKEVENGREEQIEGGRSDDL